MPKHVVTITSYRTSQSTATTVRHAKALQRLADKLAKRDDIAGVHVRIDWSVHNSGVEVADTAYELGWSHA
jgi:hypothetical protein